jgi:hypothetical protein
VRGRPRPAHAAAAAALAAALGAAPAPAAELEAGVTLESDTAYRLRSPHRLQKSQNRAELELDLELGGGLSAFASGRLIYDPVARLVGPDPDFGQRPVDRWQVDGSRELEAELRELHLDWSAPVGAARLDLRVGKQQVVWGQSFGLRVLDIVNAQDFREFILDEFVDARTPVFGARADLFVGGLALQALFFPDFEPDVLPDPESEFALDTELRGLVGELPAAPGLPPLARLRADAAPRDWRGSSAAYGLRAGGMLRGVDLALYWFDRIDPRGVFRRRTDTVALGPGPPVPVSDVRREFERVRSLGFSFATTRGSFGFWGEGTLSHGRPYVVNDLSDADGSVRRSDLEYALGLDWTGWAPLFLNLQWIHYVTFGSNRHLELDESREFVSLLARLSFRNETLLPQLFVLYGLDEQETMIRPSLEWRATDRLALIAGVDLFTGPREGLLGQYARRRECQPVPAGLPVPGAGGCLFDAPPGRTSRAFLRVRYSFGWRH